MSRPTRVLVVEDHDDIRRALTITLRRKGFEVNAYDRCEPAERHVAACDIDIALLDVRLPGRCGDDFGRELSQRCPNTMIIFVTGEATLDPLKKAVPNSFVMRKPFDTALLLELLERFRSRAGCSSDTEKQTNDRVVPDTV